ncbi:hypothetical protein BDP27DRAFT_1315554 [Rhodocollybia butyracea]|uniref:Uncharacterized protein n=1 Tax=Rhodocollybia butyracea TaxID=206335 RepID=A0A9P5Q476_9AGAR|nr:hypothetical protein BDP27DRAFT_1315554 [Rhodocollybia butyracea]
MHSNKHSEPVSSPSSSETGAIVTGVISGSLILAGAICVFYLLCWYKRERTTRMTPLTLEANSLRRS